MKPRRYIRTGWASVVVALAGCGDLESSPVPQPVPMLIRSSTPEQTSVDTLYIGLPGAVAGQGKVHIRSRQSGQTVVVPATAAGTFAARVPKDALDLEARYESADGLSDPVPLAGQRLGEPLTLGDPQPGVVSGTYGPDEVVVTNDGTHGTLLEAPPNVDVIVANATTGVVVTTKTDANGRFTTQITASKGDLIQIMVVDPDDPGNTSDFVEITVP